MKRNPDTIEHIEQSDLFQLSSELLEAVVESTDALTAKKLTPERIKEYKTVLGFLNATNSVMKSRLSCFKMTGLSEKINFIRKADKKL